MPIDAGTEPETLDYLHAKHVELFYFILMLPFFPQGTEGSSLQLNTM